MSAALQCLLADRHSSWRGEWLPAAYRKRKTATSSLASRPASAHPWAPLLALRKNGFLQRVAGWQQKDQTQIAALSPTGSGRASPATRYIGVCSEMRSFAGLKVVELDTAPQLRWLPCPQRSFPSSSSHQEAKDKATQLHTALHWVLSWPLS